MAHLLKLTLNGTFLAEGPEGPITGIGRRGQALLAFLSLEPRQRATRVAAMTLLWGDRGDEQARASLRQELSALRRTLPEGVLLADRAEVWLEKAALVEPPNENLLSGFDLRSEAFEDWLRLARAAVRNHPPAPASPNDNRGRPVIAVLPFPELGVAESDMFADGVVEEITGALSRVGDFDVIARQSAFAMNETGDAIPDVARRLGADYLVEGSVRRSGDRIRISVQLVRGHDAHTLWSERFDDRLDDLFDLQDRIAANVAGHLSPNVRLAEIDRARTSSPSSRTAYELVLSAMPHFWSHTRAGNARALDLLDTALRIEPNNGTAMAYKAWALAQQPSYLWSKNPAADRQNAARLAKSAVRHAANHAPSLVAIGAAISLVSTELDLSNNHVDRALSIDPCCAWGWLRRGWNRNYSGATEEARRCFDRAEELSPLDPFRFNIEFGRGGSRLNEKRYEEALDHFKRGMTMAPEVQWAYRVIAVLNLHLGRKDEATEALTRLKDAYPGLTIRMVAQSIPPTIIENQPEYYDALRSVGLPDF